MPSSVDVVDLIAYHARDFERLPLTVYDELIIRARITLSHAEQGHNGANLVCRHAEKWKAQR